MAFKFLFDTNKCTGCHACAVACIIENQVQIKNSWRQIISYNQNHLPGLYSFHLSLACNHCDDPPCLKYCPAIAYSKDDHTGCIVLNHNSCIGCKYCTWVCPYDAPKFNKDSGIVEKCTFCLHRLQRSKEPACVALCPTDALNIGNRTSATKTGGELPGFRDYDISPGIEIIAVNQNRRFPEVHSAEYADSVILEVLKKQQVKNDYKINAKNEWTLLLLSLVFPFLIALSSVIIIENSNSFLIPFIISAGIFSLGISSLHLGKKTRAYRAVFNLRNSWLSREIAFLFLFLSSLTLQYLFQSHMLFLKAGTLIFGFLALFSMDKVYTVIPKITIRDFNSAIVALSAIYWYGILTMNFYIIGLIGGLRIFLYLENAHKDIAAPVVRIISGYFGPAFLLIAGNSNLQPFIVLGVIIGEIIERYGFYKSIDIITPLRQMQLDEESNYAAVSMQNVKDKL